jgi:hypothetical protein
LRKTKELQSSAGKRSGMSGRDLVCRHFLSWFPSQSCTHCVIFFVQFQYNPECFQDKDDGDASDDWDLAKYRREQEEDNLAAVLAEEIKRLLKRSLTSPFNLWKRSNSTRSSIKSVVNYVVTSNPHPLSIRANCRHCYCNPHGV